MVNEYENPWSVADLDAFQYYCCPECDEREPSKEIFLHHALNNHPKSKEYFDNVPIKKEVIENDTSICDEPILNYEIVKCEIQEEEFTESISNDPLNTIENNKNHVCNICGQSFSRLYNLQRHHKNVHEAFKGQKCEFCEECFAKNGELKRHVEIFHMKPKEFICNVCNQSFDKRYNLERHIKSVHKELNPQNRIKITQKNSNALIYKCDICNKNYPDLNEIQFHIEDVHDGKYQCKHCDICFEDWTNLNEHITGLVIEKNFQFFKSIVLALTSLHSRNREKMNLFSQNYILK